MCTEVKSNKKRYLATFFKVMPNFLTRSHGGLITLIEKKGSLWASSHCGMLDRASWSRKNV
jgi:hypothetical protein